MSWPMGLGLEPQWMTPEGWKPEERTAEVHEWLLRRASPRDSSDERVRPLAMQTMRTPMYNASHVQLLSIAELTLRGESDARIAAAFGIDLAVLTTLRKSVRYNRTEQRLAEQILTAAAGRLQALATVAVNKLESIVQIPAKNQTRNGQHRADPALLKEQRLTAQPLLPCPSDHLPPLEQ